MPVFDSMDDKRRTSNEETPNDHRPTKNKESLSDHDLRELMGMNRDKYQRIKGRIRRK